MTTQTDDLRFLLVNLTHIHRAFDTQLRCKPEEIKEFLKFVNESATSHSNQCVCYLSHKILTRIFLLYPSLIAKSVSCAPLFQDIPTSGLLSFLRKIYSLQTLQYLLKESYNSLSRELIRSIVSYLYSQKLSFTDSYFSGHKELSCSRVEQLALFESLLLLIRTMLQIHKTLQLERAPSVVTGDIELSYMINEICNTFLFSKSFTEIYANTFLNSPFERVFYCGLIDLTYRYVTVFSNKETVLPDEITRVVIHGNKEFIRNLEPNQLHTACAKELTLRLDTKERCIKIITDTMLLCLDLFRFYLLNNPLTLKTKGDNCEIMLDRISHLISVSRKTPIPHSVSQSAPADSSLFYFYSQDDKSLFKFISILLELHSSLASNLLMLPDVKSQIYRTLPEPNQLFLSFLIHTGFDHVLMIDLITCELNSTFMSCFSTFLNNLLLFDKKIDAVLFRKDNLFISLHLSLTTYLIDGKTPTAGSSIAYQFTDLLYKVFLFLSKHISKKSTRCISYLKLLLGELIMKYDLSDIEMLTKNS